MLNRVSVPVGRSYPTRNDLQLTNENDYIEIFVVKSTDEIPIGKWFALCHKIFLKMFHARLRWLC